MTIQKLVVNLKKAYAKASLVCADGLRPPATDDAIRLIGLELKLSIPDELRDLLRVHGGQNHFGAGIEGLLGCHRLLGPLEIVEHYRIYSEHCVQNPSPEFPPKPGEWGYWVPDLIPFASWDSYDLCIHSHRADVWEFCPTIGLTANRTSIAEILRELTDAVNAGKKTRIT